MSRKEKVEVIACLSSYDLVLTELIWKHNKHYPIERVLHTCKCVDNGMSVIRHTVLIDGKQKYIFQDENNNWYVNVVV